MKRGFIIGITTVVIGLLLAVAQFYWSNLRGSGPALTKPPADITDLVDAGNVPTPQKNERPEFPLRLPKDFEISIFAKGLGAPRVMTFDFAGNLLVSIPSEGKVVALKDADGDGYAEDVRTVIDNLNKPHGLTTRCTQACLLYIAEEDGISAYQYDLNHLQAFDGHKILDLPAGGRHTTRTIIFLPAPNDGKLLISVGSACDVCHEEDEQRGTILSANADGSDLKIFARGVRNSVFMNIHPITGDVWATDMGRDHLGDNLPPDEINIIQEGRYYGWPICYGKNVHDTDFDKRLYKRNPCQEPFETPSYIDIPAHSAPLGIAFFPEEGWPEEYWYNALVAYHGSWNRTEPTGYKIVRYRLDAKGQPLKGATRLSSKQLALEEDFITGWLTDKGALGRPVDILIQPGGILFVSDDKAGVIYRILYRPDKPTADDRIHVTTPQANDSITSPVTVTGEARGTWFFEASFPVKLTDANGKEIATGIAQAQGDWMTEDFVPFESQLEFALPSTDTGTLIVHKDNPSGLPEHDASVSIPVTFAPRR